MIVNFENVKKQKKKQKQYQPMNDKELYDSVLEEMDALDVEEACLGAIMAAIGQNTVLGVDYTFQKEKFLEQARRFNYINQSVWYLYEKSEKHREEHREE